MIKIEAARRLMEAAVPINLVRPVMGLFNKARYAEIFNKFGSGKGKQKYRIYIPLESGAFKADKVIAPDDIAEAVAGKGYVIENYPLGLAIDSSGKRTMKIGKLLSDHPELLKKFANDPKRGAAKQSNLIMVISRHPYDIMGMSFDRGWTSCMHATDGVNKRFLKADVKEGSLVAYVVKNTDKNINSPMARITIRPFENKTNHILAPGPVYGTAPSTFANHVSKFCIYMNSGAPAGNYKLVKGLYNDLPSEQIYKKKDPTDLPKNTKDRAALAENATCPSSVLAELSKDEDYRTRSNVALNPNTDQQTLLALGNSDNVGIIWSILENPNCPKEVLEDVSVNSTNRATIIKIIRHPNCPKHVLLYLSDTENDAIRYQIASLPNCPQQILEAYVYDEDEDVRVQVAANPNTPVTALLALAKQGVKLISEKVAINPNASPEVLNALIDTTMEDTDLRLTIAGRHDCPVEILDKLSDDSNWRVRRMVAMNPNCSMPTLYKLFEDANANVKQGVATNLSRR